MATVNIIDNQAARLNFYTDTGIVHHTFHKSLDSENLRAVLNGGVELLKQHHATKWLSDNRAIGPHSEEDTEWINANWLPQAIEAGWKFWALVVPDDVMGRMNMGEFVNSFYDMGVRIKVFTDLDKAMTWLENAV